MPSGAQATPSVRVRLIAPALDAAYAGLPTLAPKPAIELTMMILPPSRPVGPPLGSSAGLKRRLQCIRLSRLTAITRSQPAHSNSPRW